MRMLAILRRAARRRHERRNERVRSADALEQLGRYGEARAVYAEALEREPAHAGALRRLAALSQLEDRIDEAEDLWRRLLAERPERADACHELARLRLRAGDPEEALRLATRAAELAPPGKPHALAHRAKNLRDHLARGEVPLAARHLAIAGMSFCGSTLLGYLLGSRPDAANVGESHALVYRRQGMRPIPVDYASDEPEGMIRCTLCGEGECPIWTVPFRRTLAADPIDWYGKLAVQAGAPILVSSDKSHAKLSGLDPFSRHDVVILFKTPSVHFASARLRPRPPKDPQLYMTRWEREYARLLHDLPVKGRKIVLHFDAFRRAPEVHLRRLLERLDLPVSDTTDPLEVDPAQHVIGGNPYTRQDVREEGRRLGIRTGDVHELPDEAGRAIAERQERSTVFAELQERHAESFDGC